MTPGKQIVYQPLSTFSITLTQFRINVQTRCAKKTQGESEL